MKRITEDTNSTRSASVRKRAVVVAQWIVNLIEWSLPKPEIRGSNPVIAKNFLNELFIPIISCLENTKTGWEWSMKKALKKL